MGINCDSDYFSIVPSTIELKDLFSSSNVSRTTAISRADGMDEDHEEVNLLNTRFQYSLEIPSRLKIGPHMFLLPIEPNRKEKKDIKGVHVLS